MEKAEKTSKKNNIRHTIVVYLTIAVSVLLILAIIWSKVLINSYIPSESMENTLMTGDRVVGNRLAYSFGEKPDRFDIVIFESPNEDNLLYIKRVIGLPGENVAIKNGQVYVDGKIIEDSFIKEEMIPESDMEFNVPANHYFMMGDNRNESFDSRYWENPYVSEDAIVAKALFRYWKGFKVIQ